MSDTQIDQSTSSITIDMALIDGSETNESVAKSISDAFDVDIKIIEAIGPAGGAAVVELSGPTANVRKALAGDKGWGMDDEDIRDLYGM